METAKYFQSLLKPISPNKSQLHNPAHKKTEAQKSLNSNQSSLVFFAAFQLLSVSGQIMQKMLPIKFLMLVSICTNISATELISTMGSTTHIFELLQQKYAVF